MRAYRIDAPGDLDSLVLRDEPQPVPGPGDVLLKLRAVSLNVRDLHVVRSTYVHDIRPGLIPVSDGVGEVVAVGAAVTRIKVGERVSPIVLQRWLAGERLARYSGSGLGGSLDGLLRDYAVLPETGVVPIPSYLSNEEAATLSLAGVAAWNGLTSGRPLVPGHAVLVQGTGGVSIFALQLAKLFGARTIALTSSSPKAARLRTLGADDAIDRTLNPEWDEEVRRLTAGRGVDRVVDVGGPATIEKSVRSLAIGGHLSVVGTLGGTTGAFNPASIIGKAIVIEGIGGGSRQDFEHLLLAMEQGNVRPVIDHIFPFHEARAAFAYFERRQHIGKVVISI